MCKRKTFPTIAWSRIKTSFVTHLCKRRRSQRVPFLFFDGVLCLLDLIWFKIFWEKRAFELHILICDNSFYDIFGIFKQNEKMSRIHFEEKKYFHFLTAKTKRAKTITEKLRESHIFLFSFSSSSRDRESICVKYRCAKWESGGGEKVFVWNPSRGKELIGW